jgi:ABC-type multidrug transport system fused ATPase/permease subunit
MRYYDPEFGQIFINGIDVKEYDICELRKAFGLVMQEPILFNYSVKENILYGNMGASNAEINEAVKIANASEFIESDKLAHAFGSDV